MNIELMENECMDDLQYRGLKLIQKAEGFKFGVDAVLLAHFADAGKNAHVLDLGTGTGIIPILISGKTEAAKVTGLEIQPDMAEMACRSVRLNNMEDRVEIICGDIKDSVCIFGASKFELVVSNPPYMNKGGGIISSSDAKAISRHEVLCTLEDVVRSASKLLVPGGTFAMVHRPDRLADIIWFMRSYGVEPKYIRFIHPSPYKKPNLLLIKGLRGGRPQLKMLDPLYIYDGRGNYTDEINRIYCRSADYIE